MMQDTIGHLNIQKQAEKFCDSSSNKFKLNPSCSHTYFACSQTNSIFDIISCENVNKVYAFLFTTCMETWIAFYFETFPKKNIIGEKTLEENFQRFFWIA